MHVFLAVLAKPHMMTPIGAVYPGTLKFNQHVQCHLALAIALCASATMPKAEKQRPLNGPWTWVVFGIAGVLSMGLVGS